MTLIKAGQVITQRAGNTGGQEVKISETRDKGDYKIKQEITKNAHTQELDVIVLCFMHQ